MTRRIVRRTSGVTLISALVAAFILTAGMTIVLQTYIVGARTLRLTEERNAVTLALEAQLETLRAGGYASLPVVGCYPILPSALPTLEDVAGEVVIARGPRPDTRQIAARVAWDHGGRRTEQLVMLMAKRGMDP